MTETVLVVDDETRVRKLLARFLSEMGLQVSAAETAEAALSLLERTSADLVLTDLKMPGLSGLELAERLLKQDPDRPVIMMTAYADVESAREAVRIGLYDYLVKPVNLQDLKASVNRALSHRRLALEVRSHQRELERKVAERTKELERKVKEVEARDQVLKQLLFAGSTVDVLGTCIRVARDLSGSDVATLYLCDRDARVVPCVAVGLGDAPDRIVEVSGFPSLNRFASEANAAIGRALQERRPVCVKEPGEVRSALGIRSYGLLPVLKQDEALGVLEVGRTRGRAEISEADVEALADFTQYVALGIVDARLQEQLPEVEGRLDEMLRAAEGWALQDGRD